MKLDKLNLLPQDQVEKELLTCCGSLRWARKMAESRPFSTAEELYEVAKTVWKGLSAQDWLEAFEKHPQIGDLKSAGTREIREQEGVKDAASEVLRDLKIGNQEYDKKFGFVFLICATGKTGENMLHELQLRLKNNKEQEILNAMAEQAKITRIRLEKILKV